MKIWSYSAVVLLCIVVGSCSSLDKQQAKAVYFEEHVKPVLQANCLRCHQGQNAPAHLDLRNGRNARTSVSPRTGRPFIIPGDPDCSLIIAAVGRLGTHPLLMPRLDLSLTEDEIGELSEWIEDGAYWPDDKRGDLRPVFNPENP